MEVGFELDDFLLVGFWVKKAHIGVVLKERGEELREKDGGYNVGFGSVENLIARH